MEIPPQVPQNPRFVDAFRLEIREKFDVKGLLGAKSCVTGWLGSDKWDAHESLFGASDRNAF